LTIDCPDRSTIRTPVWTVPPVTLEQLRIFVAVATELHMTRAAETLGITQSAASAAVAALEARHAIKLFDRVGRGIELSEAGRAFLPEAREVLSRAEIAVQSLDDLAGLRRGAVTIHASQTIASYWLPRRVVQFRKAYPQIEVRVAIGNTAQVAKAVREGEVELGFIEGAINEPSLERTRVGFDRLVIVAAPDHPWANGCAVAAKDLWRGPWVLREPGSGTRSEFENAVEALGTPADVLNVALELPSNESVVGAVSGGGLVTAISELVVAPLLTIGTLKLVSFELPERTLALLRHRERRKSRAAEAFVAML
jgi:DNA-binding transcriptional LysR family regulator